MPSDGKRPANDQSSYGENSIEMLRREGYFWLRFFCVRPGCKEWQTIRLTEAIERFGANIGLAMLARRARCKVCGARGAHVEVERKGWNPFSNGIGS